MKKNPVVAPADPDPSIPFLQQVLEREIEREVVLQRVESFIHYRTEVTRHLVKVYLAEQVLLTRAADLERLANEALASYEELTCHPQNSNEDPRR